MSPKLKPISRRQFLKAGCISTGVLGLTACGIGVLTPAPDRNPVDGPSFTYGEKTMNNRILVAYASRTGSTIGVAEVIGQTLAESGAQVDVRPMDEVKDLTPYRAMVAGSAIQNKQWLPEAMQFMRTHQAALAQKPFAAFLVCMTLTISNGKYRESVADFLQPVRVLVQPVSEGLFAGALNISKIPSFRDRLMFRLSVMFGVWSEGDHRDWDAIRAWAESIRPLLLKEE